MNGEKEIMAQVMTTRINSNHPESGEHEYDGGFCLRVSLHVCGGYVTA